MTAKLSGTVEYTNCISTGKTTADECPRFDMKQSDDKAPFLELWGMLSTPLLPLLPYPLRLGEGTPEWVLSVDQIKLFDT